MAKPALSMKLLVDTQTKTVLFAEATKDCVDFLLHILSLPVATVITLLKKQGMVGSLGKLYDSMENLNDCYLQSTHTKQAILNPVVPNRSGSSFPLLLCNERASNETGMKFYTCTNYHNNVTDDSRAICPGCNGQMRTIMKYIAPPPPVQQGGNNNEGGYVKGVVTYMVMDDLEVKPMSTISGITLLNTFKVKDVGLLQERVVTLGMIEAARLLKASLQSKQVLTDVFIKGV